MQGTEELLIDRARLARRLEAVALAMLDGMLPRGLRTGMSLMGLGDLDSKCRTAAQRIADELPAQELYTLLREIEIEARLIRDPEAEVGRRAHPVEMTRTGDRIGTIIRETFQR